MHRMAYEVGEGMDSPSTKCQEHFAPPLAPEGASTWMYLSDKMSGIFWTASGALRGEHMDVLE
jgi:hypothetical protein